MIYASIKATKLKQGGTTYWRSEFERIYILAARKARPLVQSEHCTNVPEKATVACCDLQGA